MLNFGKTKRETKAKFSAEGPVPPGAVPSQSVFSDRPDRFFLKLLSFLVRSLFLFLSPHWIFASFLLEKAPETRQLHPRRKLSQLAHGASPSSKATTIKKNNRKKERLKRVKQTGQKRCSNENWFQRIFSAFARALKESIEGARITVLLLLPHPSPLRAQTQYKHFEGLT